MIRIVLLAATGGAMVDLGSTKGPALPVIPALAAALFGISLMALVENKPVTQSSGELGEDTP